MAEVILFHHAMGLTPGVIAFADELRSAGHTVHTPDLFDGRRFDSIEAGLAHVGELGGMEGFAERGAAAIADLPSDVFYVGFSLGVVVAQQLTQTRPGARGAVLCYSFIPPEFFGDWPDGVPVQVHGASDDPFFAEEGDLDAARAFADAHPDLAEVFIYPGDQHYFADSSLPSYDAEAAVLVLDRARAFLGAR